jgi:hypothetical protein
MSVYFIRCGDHIKIGRSVDPWGRLASLQTANPFPLEMLALSPGGGEFETGLHEAFSDDNTNGEWFRVTDRLLAFIDGIRETFPKLQERPSILIPCVDEEWEGAIGPAGIFVDEGSALSTWIEFPRKGTKNPKRYAVRRAWVKEEGVFKKITLGRVKDIPPLTEEEYWRYKATGETPK